MATLRRSSARRLLNDGVNTYTYDSANRLTSLSGGQSATYRYNGLDDRLTQNRINYTLDLNTGLTQILSDGTNTYLYGIGRIAQVNATTEYFLTDALGSVRQLTDAGGSSHSCLLHPVCGQRNPQQERYHVNGNTTYNWTVRLTRC